MQIAFRQRKLFVRETRKSTDMQYTPPSTLDLAGRAVMHRYHNLYHAGKCIHKTSQNL